MPDGETWTGLYPSEIESIKMLGSDEPVKWDFSKDALAVTTPKTKPCDYAFVFRITLKKPF